MYFVFDGTRDCTRFGECIIMVIKLRDVTGFHLTGLVRSEKIIGNSFSSYYITGIYNTPHLTNDAT